MLLNNTITDPEAQAKEAYLEEIGRLIRMPFGKQKLQDIAVLWMNHPINGPENRQQMAGCALAAKELRETRANKFGSSLDPNSTLRLAFSPPAGLVQAIEAFETHPFLGLEGKKNWGIFKQAFPQFMASEVY